MTDRVTIAVVGYNDEGNIEQCVRSLRDAIDAPIVLIDNHSTDATWTVATMLASELPGVAVFRADENGGYASGANIARSQTRSEYLTVMNADCVTSGDWISPIVEHLDNSPNVAAATPTLRLADREALNAEGLDIHMAGFGFNRRLGRTLDDAARVPVSVPGVQGTAFVIRLDALDDIGGWYSGGFLYHEDVELSWALRLAGYEISHVPTPPLIHDYELTMSPEKLYLLERNRLEMLSADLEPKTKILLTPVLLATEIAVWLYVLRKRSGLVGAKVRSYRSFVQRRSVHRARREGVRSFRRITDRDLLRTMQWRYPRSQTAALRRSTPSSGRRGARDLPTS